MDSEKRMRLYKPTILSRHNAHRWADYGKAAKAIQKTWRAKRAAKKLKLASKTALQMKRKTGTVVEEGSANSMSHMRYATGKTYVPKGLLAALPVVNYVTNVGYQLTCGAGVQNISAQPLLRNDTDLAAILANSPYAPEANIKDLRMFVERVDGEYTFANTSAANAIMTIYDVILKRDAANASIYLPDVAWQTGSTDQGLANDYKYVGAEPDSIEAFKQYWKIVQKTPVIIGAGGIHRHRVHYQCNKMVSGEVLSYTSYGMQGLMVATLVAWHGSPAHDSTTKTSVTSAPVNLDVVLSKEYRVKYLQNNAAVSYASNNLASSFAVGEELFNEAVGQLQSAAGLTPGTLNA